MKRFLITVLTVAIGLGIAASTQAAPARIATLQNDPRISAASVTPTSTTLGASTTYVFTFTLVEPLDGDVIYNMSNNGCSNNQSWELCRINFAQSSLQSGITATYSAWNEGFVVQGNFAPGDYSFVVANVVNPQAASGSYRANVISYQQGDNPINQDTPKTLSDPFFLVSPAIKGTLALPNGTPITQANAELRTADFSYHNNVGTDEAGFFAFPATGLPNNTYVLSFWVNSINGYISPAPVEVVYAGSTLTQNFTMRVASKTITGIVLYDNGQPITTGAEIFANRRGGMGGGVNTQVGVDGRYSLSLEGGDWDLSLNAGWTDGGPRQVNWMYSEPPKAVSFAQNEIPETSTIDFGVIQTNASVTGRVLKPDGTPMMMGSIEMRKGDGPGSNTGMDQNGRFTMNVVAGTYKLNVWFDNNNPDFARLSFPEINVTVSENQTLNLGDLYLSQKNSRIVGRVVNEAGAGVQGATINCWQRDGRAWGRATSNGAGEYTVWMVPGPWECNLEQGQNSSYIRANNTPSPLYNIAENETITADPIVVKLADARLNVRLVNAAGQAVTSFGYAYARVKGAGYGPGSEFGTGIQQGAASIALMGGTTYVVGAHTDPSQNSYLLDSEVEIAIGQGETKVVNLLMIEPNATVRVIMQDQNGQVIRNMEGDVNMGSEGGNNWINARLQSDGSATLRVRGGTGTKYMLNYWFRGNTGFIQSPPKEAPFEVPANATLTRVLTAMRADSYVNATIISPGGDPTPYGHVWCSNRMYMEDKVKGDFSGGQIIDTGSEIRNGRATVALIAGKYQCGSGNIPGQANYMPPKMVEVEVSPTSPANITLQFREADATLRGTVTLPDGTAPRFGWCHAFNMDGGFSGSEAQDGTFAIPLTISSKPWMIGCDTGMDSGFYRSDEKTIMISAKGEYTQNFILEKKSWNMPEGLTEQFDATSQKVITLPDGTTLTIPANAFATEGNVTFTATPTNQFFIDASTRPLTFVWDFSVLDANNQLVEQFNSSANICIPYSQEVVDEEGYDESNLIAKYYDSTAGTWKLPDGVTVNTESNIACFSVDHFTNFGVATTGNAGATSNNYDIIATPAGKGGPQVVITDETGKVISRFFAYAQTLRVGIEAVTGDVDGDGVTEVITAAGTGAGSQIRIFTKTGQLKKQFFAYDSRLRTGMHVVAGDVNGDGTDEIVTSLMAGGKPEIAVYDGTGKTLKRFYAYAQTFLGGLNITLGDVNGDGAMEIITAPESKGGPQIAVYNGAGKTLKRFMAYASTVRGGYNITTGDVNADGTADIIVAPKAGNGPQVAMFTGTGTLIKRFMAYASTFRGGVNVAVGDTNGDGANEIVATPVSAAGPQVRVFGSDGNLKSQFWAYASRLRGSFTAFAKDVTGDDVAEIVTAPGAGMGPQVRVFNQAGTASHSFFTHHTGFRGGITVAPAL